MRRACYSIPSNIAEGCGRPGDAELHRYFGIAMGSANELEYQLLFARDLDYLSQSSYDMTREALVEVKRMLHGFRGRVHRDSLMSKREPRSSRLEADG
jgi:four helix bundle protein